MFGLPIKLIDLLPRKKGGFILKKKKKVKKIKSKRKSK
tara:strand:- start:2328 stop:2441 length:114 start_codon:yes stop_codon:yes gene_type:complete